MMVLVVVVFVLICCFGLKCIQTSAVWLPAILLHPSIFYSGMLCPVILRCILLSWIQFCCQCHVALLSLVWYHWHCVVPHEAYDELMLQQTTKGSRLKPSWSKDPPGSNPWLPARRRPAHGAPRRRESGAGGHFNSPPVSCRMSRRDTLSARRSVAGTRRRAILRPPRAITCYNII